jgi:hypothetical protein
MDIIKVNGQPVRLHTGFGLITVGFASKGVISYLVDHRKAIMMDAQL